MNSLTTASEFHLPVQSKRGIVRLSPAGLTVGTPVMASSGEQWVEDLRPGDRILTKDLGMQTVKCLAFRDFDLQTCGDLAPIRIPSGTFGDERPGRTVYLAPTQRIALRHRMFDVLFASREVLIAARDLIGIGQVGPVSDLRGITYVALGFVQHHLLFCGNLAVDLGPQDKKTSRPVLSPNEAQLACSLLRPHVPVSRAPASFPLH